MAATIRAVAEAAGVSTTTVSFVLNNRRPHIDAIPKQTRERVRSCAAALGYRKNAAAASLRTGRSHWIGVLIQPMKDENEAYTYSAYELALLSGVQNGLAKEGYFAVLGSKSTDGDTENLNEIAASGVGGLIFRRPQSEEVSRLKALADDGLPAIAVFPSSHSDMYPYSIDLDNLRAGEFAAEMLLKAGAKSPVCIVRDAPLESDEDRWKGFHSEITHKLGNPPTKLGLNRSASERENCEVISAFMRKNNPDAIMCTDAVGAWMANLVADELNIAVPDELSIIGFDCFHLEGPHRRRVSAVGTSWWRAGYLAAESIVDIMRNSAKWTEPIKLQPMFFAGDSTPQSIAAEGTEF